MLVKFPHTSGLVILKWKQGERNALESARVPRDRYHVIFDVPPAGDFDHEEQRPLTPTEHIQKFGLRLRQCSAKYPAFIDAIALDDERHKKGFIQHPLTELIARAQLAGAIALPVTGIGRSRQYQNAVGRFVRSNPSLPICVRVPADELDKATFASDLQSLLESLTCPPTRAFLVLDFRALAALSGAALDQFADTLVERISELPFLHRWAGLAAAMSSFPQAIKLKAGEGRAFPRADIQVYQKLLTNRADLLRTPMFGDYGVDVSPVEKPQQRRTPSAQVRYSTPDSHIIQKGTSVRKPYGYQAIRPVAQAIVARKEFVGEDFSDGDRFLVRLSRNEGSTGNAATWRWASTDHHLRLNFLLINKVFGLEEPVPRLESSAGQRDLFAEMELESPPLVPESPADTSAEERTEHPPTGTNAADDKKNG